MTPTMKAMVLERPGEPSRALRVVEQLPLAEANEALSRLRAGRVRGAAVLVVG